MTVRIAAGTAVPSILQANLDAFFRHRGDVPAPRSAALTRSLSRLRGSDDPIVAFGRLPEACVPDFADGCQIELSDGSQPSFRTVRPADDDSSAASGRPIDPEQLVVTPFRAVPLVGFASYAGVVTFWWTSRRPAESDVVTAELMVRHVVALVEHERLLEAVAQAEDRAASLALEAISGRAISLAVGIVMHQNGLSAGGAEHVLRQLAGRTGTDLHQVAVGIVRSGAFGASAP
jgi:hypothetical protein